MSVYDFDVDSLDRDSFAGLVAAVRRRLAREQIGYGDLEEMAAAAEPLGAKGD